MTADEYTLTVGRTKDGIYWARLDSDTHYARATADDAWTAALNAVHEAQFLISQPNSPSGEPGSQQGQVARSEAYTPEPDGYRVGDGGRILPTSR